MTFGSCSNDKNKITQNDIIKLLQNYELEHNNDTKAYLFLPLDGCGECIKISVKFVKENLDLTNIKYVLSSASRKIFSINFGKEILNSEIVIIDDDLYRKIYELAINKPVLYLFKYGKIQYIIQIDDSNSENVLNVLLKDYLNL